MPISYPHKLGAGSTKHKDISASSESLDKSSALIPHSVVDALSKGDKGAFRVVYLQLYDSLKKFLQLLLHDSDDAEDVVQDVFMYILQNPEKIDPSKNFRGYLYTIVRNAAFKKIRDKHKVENYAALLPRTEIDFANSPEEIAISDETALIISVYLEGLSPQRRRVYTLSRMEGKSHREIAEMLELSENTVKSHIQTVNKGLRELLALLVFLLGA